VCVLANGLWAIAIAGATYLLLTQPMSKAARSLHRYLLYVILSATIWGLGLINAMVGYAIFDFQEVAGFCLLKDSGLFGKLDLFIPRAVTTVVVLAIYIRLYFFFRYSGTKIEKSLTAASRALERSVDTPAAPEWLSRQLSRIQTNMSVGDRPAPASDKRTTDRNLSHDSEATLFTRRSSEVTLITRSHQREEEDDAQDFELPSVVKWNTSLWEKTLDDSHETTGAPCSPKTYTFADLHVAPSMSSRQSSQDGSNTEYPSRSMSISGGTLPAIPSCTDLAHIPSATNLLHCDSQQSHDASLRSFRSDSIDAQFEAMSRRHRKSTIDYSTASGVKASKELASFTDMLRMEDGERAPSPQQRRLSNADMNKKASLLMLLYPAAYVLLFSTSLARVIVDFIGKPGPSNGILHAASRFMILSNGTCDAIIYVLVEWSFRRSAKA